MFKTPLDYPAMFALPGMQEMIGQQMSAMGSKMSESDFKVMMDMFQRMAKGMKFSMTQSVDLESNMFI